MASIVTLTVNPTIDKSSSVDTVASEIKLRCAAPSFEPGGGGINVSRAIQNLGGDSLAIHTSGGALGQFLEELLVQQNLRTLAIPIQGMTRENLTVFEETTTLQFRFGMPGPDMQESEWQACLDAVFVQDAGYIVASGSLAPAMPDNFYEILAQRAKGTKSRVIVDTSGKALEACARAGVFLLKPNLGELETLSGQQFQTEERLIEIVRDLIRGGMAEVFVISMGGSGAMMISADDSVIMRPPVVPIRSKVGAGDSMVGGIVWALAKGEDFRSAIRYGIAAGSAAVMNTGIELCRAEDVFAIYPRIAVLD